MEGDLETTGDFYFLCHGCNREVHSLIILGDKQLCEVCFKEQVHSAWCKHCAAREDKLTREEANLWCSIHNKFNPGHLAVFQQGVRD